jgi:hypothetical protein
VSSTCHRGLALFTTIRTYSWRSISIQSITTLAFHFQQFLSESIVPGGLVQHKPENSAHQFRRSDCPGVGTAAYFFKSLLHSLERPELQQSA